MNFNCFFLRGSGEQLLSARRELPNDSNRAAHRLVGVLPPHHAHDDDRSPALRRAAGRRAASNMSAWSLVGLLIAVRVDAVDEVSNFMKSGGPALTRRRLDACIGQIKVQVDPQPFQCQRASFATLTAGSMGEL